MKIYISTVCLAGATDQNSALAIAKAWDLVPLELGNLPGDSLTPGKDVLLANMAFLPRWPGRLNLGTSDEGLRKSSVKAVGEALARCADTGIPLYTVEAGWSLDTTIATTGNAAGTLVPRKQAIRQLLRSLDQLAAISQQHGIRLGISNMPHGHGGLLTAATEMRQVIATIGAPHLGLSLDLDFLEQLALVAGFDPKEAALAVRDLIFVLYAGRAIKPRSEGGSGPALVSAKYLPRDWQASVASQLSPVPFVLNARSLLPEQLIEIRERWLENCHATA
ncbi:MAG: TIM barrel protein [Cyanobacteria bacterium NC_groundwater_1444_Ag_S-0.65um_54_12]|nr:TIM barrel protein [Cyanobacteria bacterium NC_groundwater_1444_Ag_S-0.65um_54_12]